MPRWGGNPASDFYPWHLDRLRVAHPGLFTEARALALPRPELPDVVAWPAALTEALGEDAAQLANTYVLAHSVSCQALLRNLANLPDGVKLGGVLCGTGWRQIDQPWDSIRPWLGPLLRLAHIRAAMSRLTVLLSDNDPFTVDHAANGQLGEQRLGAAVRLASGGRHFNAPEEPAVLAALLSLCRP